MKVLRPGDIRRIAERHALVLAGNAPPIIATLRRCFDGKQGRLLKAELDASRKRVRTARAGAPDLAALTADAVAYARANRLSPAESGEDADRPLPADDELPLHRWLW